MARTLRLALALAVAFPTPAAAAAARGPALPPAPLGPLSIPVDAGRPAVLEALKGDPASAALGTRIAATWDAAAYLLKGVEAAGSRSWEGVPASPADAERRAQLEVQAQSALEAWKASPAPEAPAGSPAAEALQALGALLSSLDSAGAGPAASRAALDAAFSAAARRRALDLVPAPPADVFKPMSRDQKAAFLSRYLEHLKRRDGEPDRASRRFSVRERFFEELERTPVVRSGPAAVDAEAYDRSEPLEVPEKSLAARADTLEGQRTLWALMMGKANRGEAFAVGQLMKRSDYKDPRPDDPMTWIAIEEFYHTRILKDALKVLGLSMRELPPPPVVKALAFLMARLPRFISHTFVMSSEVIGVAVFRLLRDKARELFADEPESLARMDALLQQIIVDEVGHVHFVRSQLGPVRLWIAKKLVPLSLGAIMARGAEAELLFGRKALIDAAKAADIDGAASEYPDRFVPFPKR